jgi:hypothetical protein
MTIATSTIASGAMTATTNIATPTATATATTHGKCSGRWWWCTTSTPVGACWVLIDDNVISFHQACALLLLAHEDHMQEGNLLVDCVRRVDALEVRPVGTQIQAAILPHKTKMGVGVACKRDLVLTPW